MILNTSERTKRLFALFQLLQEQTMRDREWNDEGCRCIALSNVSEVFRYLQKTDGSHMLAADVKKCYDCIDLVNYP